MKRFYGRAPLQSRQRRALVQALAAGALGATGIGVSTAQLLGKVPRPLPAGRSIYTLRGEVTVDEIAADLNTAITPNSRVRTGPGGQVAFVVGSEAFLLRANSRMDLMQDERTGLTRSLRLLSGKLLSVFGSGRFRAQTSLATIGIRGTGVYLEAEAERSYICTCYGTTRIAAIDDPSLSEEIVTRHHDAPRYVYATGRSDARIQPAPFVNHTDDELALLEALVGRTPPFSVPGEYGAPRRDY